MRYSKGSIYPGVEGASGWDVDSNGVGGGLAMLQITRPHEIAAGDELNAPFMAAGWASAEEYNMRPAQWLGFLKLVHALGAEFVEAGFFSPMKWTNTPGGKNVQLAANYIWQAAMPSYAQAVVSLWQDLLFDGHVLEGDTPMTRVDVMCGHSDICNYEEKHPGQQVNGGVPGFALTDGKRTYLPPVSYRYWAGTQDLMVIVRKHNRKVPSQFIITGSIQPQSNLVGNTPLNVTASIDSRQ
eukprot:SAG31_NODE_517_length_14689_cov_5.110487_2_plen_240_part_00